MEEFNALPENTNDIEITQPEEKIEPAEDFEQTLAKLKVRDQILRYNVSFKKYLEAYQQKILEMDDLDISQLNQLLSEIQISVSSRTSGQMIKGYYNSLMSTVEYIAPVINMNLSGLSKILAETQEIQECIEELNIKYDIMKHVPPESRLLLTTLNCILAVNRENKKLAKITNLMAQPVRDEHIQEFNDL
jgi:hypothetical protein